MYDLIGMEYDVFISCKSEDYKYAEEIYDFLTSQGVNTFLASKELRNLGDSEYRRAISSAMKSAYHMIVFASKAEYVDSTWVYYEWDMYVNAMLKGFKKGQIVTILKDLKSEEINMDLWKYESFDYADYKDSILSYIETPSYIERREEERRQRLEQERAEAEKHEMQRIKAQKDLVSGIRISISALNNSEDKAKIGREQLLFQIQSVDNETVRNELIDTLDNSGPLHVENRSLKEIVEQKDALIEELRVENVEKSQGMDQLASELQRTKQELGLCLNSKSQYEAEDKSRFNWRKHSIFTLITVAVSSIVLIGYSLESVYAAYVESVKIADFDPTWAYVGMLLSICTCYSFIQVIRGYRVNWFLYLILIVAFVVLAFYEAPLRWIYKTIAIPFALIQFLATLMGYASFLVPSDESRMSSWKLAKKESFWSYLNPFRHWGMYASILYGVGIWVILELVARV